MLYFFSFPLLQEILRDNALCLSVCLSVCLSNSLSLVSFEFVLLTFTIALFVVKF